MARQLVSSVGEENHLACPGWLSAFQILCDKDKYQIFTKKNSPGGRARVNAGSFCVFILNYSNIQFNFRNILLKMWHWWDITRNAFTLEENRKRTSLGSAQGCRWRWWIISITLNKYLYRIIRNTLPRPDWEGLTWDGKLTLSSGWEGDLGRRHALGITEWDTLEEMDIFLVG